MFSPSKNWLVLGLFLIGCSDPGNTFLNANLDEGETEWAQETMTSLCQESDGHCCPSLGYDGENTLVVVTYLPNGYSGLTHYDELTMGGYSPSLMSILDFSEGEKSYHKYAFQCLLKHELVHHCLHKKGHLGKGNMMAKNALDFPQDCKLTKADVSYIKSS